MAKEEGIEMEGIVLESVKGAFRVQVVEVGEDINEEAPGAVILSHLGGKLRKHVIKVVPGDRVKIEVSPYDMTRARITYRMK